MDFMHATGQTPTIRKIKAKQFFIVAIIAITPNGQDGDPDVFESFRALIRILIPGSIKDVAKAKQNVGTVGGNRFF